MNQAFKDNYTQLLGKQKADVFFEYCKKPLRKSLRINTLKYTFDDAKKLLSDRVEIIKKVDWCTHGFFIDTSTLEKPLGTTLLHSSGGIYIQEASSMIPVEALFYGVDDLDFDGITVGDIAASPGSKTTQIAERMNGKGILLANELSSTRIKALYSNLERCGVSNSILTHYEGENLCALLPSTFDFLLLDAPCTGEGTVRKNFKALDNWSENDAIAMGQIQKKLIRSAFLALKKGGEMVYSTCTLGAEENSNVVEYLRSEFPEEVEIINLENLFPGAKKAVTPEGYLQLWPELFNTEGFFVAKIRRKNEGKNMQNDKKIKPEKVKIPKKLPFQLATKNEAMRVVEYFLEHWEFSLPSSFRIWKRENEYWAFPKGSEKFLSTIKCDRVGVRLGEEFLKKEKFQWKTDYQVCAVWGNKIQKNVYNASKQEARQVLKGENIDMQNTSLFTGEVLVKYENVSLSFGKIMKNKWKNQLPRVLLHYDVWI